MKAKSSPLLISNWYANLLIYPLNSRQIVLYYFTGLKYPNELHKSCHAFDLRRAQVNTPTFFHAPDCECSMEIRRCFMNLVLNMQV